jgi:cytidine deaminase
MTSTQDLIDAAREIQAESYAPYSEYAVGAALLTSAGTVHLGCNVENANFSNSLHAEEVAIGDAVRDGHREFDRLAVSSGARDGVLPCGMCRQTLVEFCSESFLVLTDHGDGIQEYRLGDILPDAIGPADL